MPEIYRSCRFVWCWENPGGVDDFSNILWEAIFSNTPCIVNHITKEKIKAEGISKTIEALLLELDDTSLFEFDFQYVTTETNLSEYKKLIYEKYIDRNVALYKKIL